MLRQEVAFVPTPAALLRPDLGERSVLLDGNCRQSWGDGTVLYSANPIDTLEIHAPCGRDVKPLESLQSFADYHLANGCVGVMVALSYDLKHFVERLDRRHPWPATPLVYAAAFEWAYRADRSTRRAEIVAAHRQALAAGEQLSSSAPLVCARPLRVEIPKPTMQRSAYIEMIERAKQYIAAGDIYQANLAQSFRGPLCRADALQLFARWTSRFPAPYAAYVDGGEWALVCNSPECFLDIRGNSIATFPIKGTRPLLSGDEAAAVSADLAADPKDRAEHVMVVDLERNDLGRICVPGSVFVPAMAKTCEFPMLIHMISEVCGTLRDEIGIADILRASFPGGSITGAPKVRAMQIIEELEPGPRGFYTGSIGWLEPGGRARFNIAIRTVVVGADGQSFHAGGGIVADSDPDREYEETLAKSSSLFRVLAELEDEIG